jgi:hypothetical protein
VRVARSRHGRAPAGEARARGGAAPRLAAASRAGFDTPWRGDCSTQLRSNADRRPVTGTEAYFTEGAAAGLEETGTWITTYPNGAFPIRFWSADHGAAEGQIFLDLDPSGSRHQTILTQLNSPSRFLPVATGTDGRIELINRTRLLRLVPGPDVLQSDVFTRGFAPSREEEAEVWLTDGSSRCRTRLDASGTTFAASLRFHEPART